MERVLNEIRRYDEELRYLRHIRDDFSAPVGAYVPPDDTMLTLVADVYFRLNTSYMQHRRFADGHWSRPEKIAALSTLSVMLVRPIQTAPDDRDAFYLNPFFALRCGFNRFGARFTDLDLRSIRRMAGWLDKFRVASSDYALDVLFAARQPADGPNPPFPITAGDAPIPLTYNELFDIDLLVSFYDVLKRLVDRLRPEESLV